MAFAWTREAQEAMEVAALSGLSATTFGERIGLSRSAVLGRAHRTGVKFRSRAITGPSIRARHIAARLDALAERLAEIDIQAAERALRRALATVEQRATA